MISFIILLGSLGYGCSCVISGEWGRAGVCLAIFLLVAYMRHAGRKGDRAYGNWINYWAEGGPDKKK